MKKITVTYELEDHFDEKDFLLAFHGKDTALLVDDLLCALRSYCNNKGWDPYYKWDNPVSDDCDKLVGHIFDFIKQYKEENSYLNLE